MNNINEEFDLDLPQTSDLTLELFSDSIDKYSEKDSEGNGSFNVDQFLMDNNFQYTELDSLIRSVSGLTDEAVNNLLQQITNNYDDYVDFFKTYNGEDDEVLISLQRTKADVEKFNSGLLQLTGRDIPRTKETIADIIDYLKSLDEITLSLDDHKYLLDKTVLGKKLSRTLHEMCGLEEWDEIICVDLIKEINNCIGECQNKFTMFKNKDLNSQFLNHLRNEYQGLIQEFQLSLKILTESCLQDPTRYSKLTSLLVSLYKHSQISS